MSSKQISHELRNEIREMFFERFSWNTNNPRLLTCIYHSIKDASVEIEIPIKYQHETELEYRQIELLEDCETIKIINFYTEADDNGNDEDVKYIKDKTLWLRYELLLLNEWL